MRRLLLNISITCLILHLSYSFAHGFKLPDTGETKCYDSSASQISCVGTGQAAEYSINPISYTDNGDSTVTDNNTGLLWQKCIIGQNNDSTCSGYVADINWYQASGTYDATYNPSSQNVCGDLILGGQSGWRLPSEQELQTIVDYSIPYHGPAIQQAYFPTGMNIYYWSPDTYVGDSNQAWLGFFADGRILFLPKNTILRVRCVHGEQTSSSFSVNGDGTVIDNKTGLIWQQAEVGKMPWVSALTYCRGLSLGGASDWRLPNAKELDSITDHTRYNPAIDIAVFPAAYHFGYWSSSSYAYDQSQAWTLAFYDGSFNFDSKGVSWYVRCVRGGGIVTCPGQAAKVSESNVYYTSLQAAYTAANNGQTVLAQAVDFTEPLTFSGSKDVTLKGGYDCRFGTNSGDTTVQGSLTIGPGTVTIENLIIK